MRPLNLALRAPEGAGTLRGVSAPVDRSDRNFFVFNAALSLIALAVIAYLLMVKRTLPHGLDVSFLPTVYASCNGLAAVLLVLGYRAIRSGKRRQHQLLMLGAFGASLGFLVGYLFFHYVHGDRRYTGALRPLYLFTLASHVLLSLPLVPLVLTTMYFGSKGRYAVHRKVARVTFPVWLYVSVTGVVVYLFLR